jgi:hypothetical protein
MYRQKDDYKHKGKANLTLRKDVKSKDFKFFCSICKTHVHPRSKHCGDCNKCIAVFDHHCKWLNNCIG